MFVFYEVYLLSSSMILIPVIILSFCINMIQKKYGIKSSFLEIFKYRLFFFLLTILMITVAILSYGRILIFENIYFLFVTNTHRLPKILLGLFIFFIPVLFYYLKTINKKNDNIIDLVLKSMIILHAILLSILDIALYMWILSN